MKDCNHPKLQEIEKLYTMTVRCPDCEHHIFFLADRVHEIMKEVFGSPSKPMPTKSSEIGSLNGVPIFISKGVDEK